MSSLKAARADNFYHPPEWDPRSTSRAQFATRQLRQPEWKAHPLRERAKRLADEGVLTVRFEMPFHVRCTGCGGRIAKGVRFNAQKKCVGKYLSTKLWAFTMMCSLEDGTWRTDRRRNPHFIEVRTDPKAADYVVASGATRVGDLDNRADAMLPSAEERGVEELGDPEERAKRAADPFYALEHAPATQNELHKRRAKRIDSLHDQRDDAWRDDYSTSQMLRKQHRQRRQSEFEQKARALARGIRLDLLPETPEDTMAVGQVVFGAAKRRRSGAARSEKRLRLLSGSIFAGSEGRPKSAEIEEEARAQALQLRRARDMRIACRPTALPEPTPPASLKQAAPSVTVGERSGTTAITTVSSLVGYSDSEEEDNSEALA